MKKKQILWIGVSLLFLVGSIWLYKEVIFLRALGPGWQDFSKSVNGRYELLRSSENTVMVVPKDGWGSKDAIIPEKVIRLNDYKDFIVAERQGLKSQSADSLYSYMIPDSGVVDYWILNVEENYVIGKLSKKAFSKTLDSLKIPNNIELIDIYKY